MLELLELPDFEDLPITEGPPDQKEPPGQELGGPRPEDVRVDLAKMAYMDLEVVQHKLSIPRAMPMVTGAAAVAAMQQLLHIGEYPAGSNCNVITKRAGVGCVAWCDITVWTAWWNAGFNDGQHATVPFVATNYWFGDAYVPNTMRHFQAAGRFGPTGVPGSAGVHLWGGPESNSHIVMLVQDNKDGTVLNIEGNHNNVCEYVRRNKADSTRRGYCTPPFSSAPAPTPAPTPKPKSFHHQRMLRAQQLMNS